MNSIELLAPILGGGIRSVNFFNGRLLSGEDMSKEQAANREGRRLLGQAVGEGIAYGLEVTKAAGAGTKPILTIQSGLAVNRRGDALRLTSPVDLSLVRPQNGSAAGVAALTFKECSPIQGGVYVTGAGVYLLTMTPALGSEGRALVSGLTNATADCNTKYLIDGVQFRLIQLDMTPGELNDQNRLRNVVAYKCFGTADIQSFIRNPFGPPLERYGLLDTLRPNRLTDCDVPLAVLYWTTDGIQFVDMWSVRRKPIPRPRSSDWPLPVSERRLAEAGAVFLQFQDQMDALLGSGLSQSALAAIRATDHFDYLPPAGFLPLSRGSFRGVDPANFFGQQPHRDLQFLEFIDGVVIRELCNESMTHEPIDLSAGELVWLYRAWQHTKAVEGGEAVQPYVIFTSGHMPHMARARFDVARWDYSNYVD